jgi:hypothetical protein
MWGGGLMAGALKAQLVKLIVYPAVHTRLKTVLIINNYINISKQKDQMFV